VVGAIGAIRGAQTFGEIKSGKSRARIASKLEFDFEWLPPSAARDCPKPIAHAIHEASISIESQSFCNPNKVLLLLTGII
jgi:hypothetical protein